MDDLRPSGFGIFEGLDVPDVDVRLEPVDSLIEQIFIISGFSVLDRDVVRNAVDFTSEGLIGLRVGLFHHDS